MNHAFHGNEVMSALNVIIIVSYLLIAGQFLLRGRSTPKWTKARVKMNQLFVIFVFCSLCGYMPMLVHISNGLNLTNHIILALAAARFAFDGSIDVLALAVDKYEEAQTVTVGGKPIDG